MWEISYIYAVFGFIQLKKRRYQIKLADSRSAEQSREEFLK